LVLRALRLGQHIGIHFCVVSQICLDWQNYIDKKEVERYVH